MVEVMGIQLEKFYVKILEVEVSSTRNELEKKNNQLKLEKSTKIVEKILNNKKYPSIK